MQMKDHQEQPKWNDQRDATLRERLSIGFFDMKDKWTTAEAAYTNETLTICGHPVMERWEEDYMKELATIAAMNGGAVLEVGYGMGISSGFIQEHNVDKHLIIEANTEVLERAKIFAGRAKRPVQLISGFWEDVVPEIAEGSLSGILFDTYPLVPEEVHKNHFSFFREAHRMLRPGGTLTYYSDEISRFSPEHMRCLRAAGFKKISGYPCRVTPPKDCKYWSAKTILAPVIVK